MPAAPERARDRSSVELRHPRAHDGEHPPVHLHETDEGPAVRQVDDLVGQGGDALDVLRPSKRAQEQLVPTRLVRL